jgi:hypothetical protein
MFADTLGTIQTNAQTTAGHGIVPQLVRITTHLADVLHDLINDVAFTSEDATAGMTQIREHAQGLVADSPTVSTTSNADLLALKLLITQYADEFTDWVIFTEPRDYAQAKSNTEAALHRVAAVATTLDRELANIRDSDPGRDI